MTLTHASFPVPTLAAKYNNVRPHEALGMKTPAEVYIPSDPATEKIAPWEYGGEYHVIKVNNVHFGDLSQTMIDQYISARTQMSFSACFRNRIAEFKTGTY